MCEDLVLMKDNVSHSCNLVSYRATFRSEKMQTNQPPFHLSPPHLVIVW